MTKNFDAKAIGQQVREANENREATSGGFVVRISDVLERHGLTGRITKDGEVRHKAGKALDAVVEALDKDDDKFVRARVRQVAFFTKAEVDKTFAAIRGAKVKGVNNVNDTLSALNKARKAGTAPTTAAKALLAEKREKAEKAAEKAAERANMTSTEIAADRVDAMWNGIAETAAVEKARAADHKVSSAMAETRDAVAKLAKALRDHKPAEKKATGSGKKKAAEKAGADDASEAMADILGQFDAGQQATLMQLMTTLAKK